jgi:hypothetical protein
VNFKIKIFQVEETILQGDGNSESLHQDLTACGRDMDTPDSGIFS